MAGGFVGTNPADPLNTTLHMALIMNLGGEWLEVALGGIFTVPEGVSGELAMLQVNDAILYDNDGAYTFHVEVCNPETPCEGIYLPFSTEDFGWEALGDGTGEHYPPDWLPGKGWSTHLDPSCYGGTRWCGYNEVNIRGDVDNLTLTSWKMQTYQGFPGATFQTQVFVDRRSDSVRLYTFDSTGGEPQGLNILNDSGITTVINEDVTITILERQVSGYIDGSLTPGDTWHQIRWLQLCDD